MQSDLARERLEMQAEFDRRQSEMVAEFEARKVEMQAELDRKDVEAAAAESQGNLGLTQVREWLSLGNTAFHLCTPGCFSSTDCSPAYTRVERRHPSIHHPCGVITTVRSIPLRCTCELYRRSGPVCCKGDVIFFFFFLDVMQALKVCGARKRLPTRTRP